MGAATADERADAVPRIGEPGVGPMNQSEHRPPSAGEIAEMRRWANITQEEAAEMVYTTPHTWWRWENGKTKMHPSRWELFLRKVHEYVFKP